MSYEKGRGDTTCLHRMPLFTKFARGLNGHKGRMLAMKRIIRH